MDLPTGTITFLFTDIEGSSRRWEDDRDQMETSLRRHNDMLRSSIEDHRGHVVKTEGDAFFAVFNTPAEGLLAAVTSQRLLGAATWGTDGPLLVRMALHSGVAQEREGDYFGPSVNRAARLLSAAHGGQVLLSSATQALVRDDIPPEVLLKDLGTHRLRDLHHTERVFQVVAPDLMHDFPPLRTHAVAPNTLPIQPTPFIGRQKELASITGAILRDDVRLLTLTGTGGTGKTRLAIQTAKEVFPHFADGVFFATLAAVSDPGLVPSTIAAGLDLQEIAGQPLIETLKSYLRDKQLLVVVDNFEHILDASSVVGELVASCASLKILVTSRESLNLAAEHVYVVPPLSVPEPKHLATPDSLSRYDAVALFIQRAQAARADFTITGENAAAIAEICNRLDGLPLAIELAAARVRLLPPHALLQRLSSRLTLLTGGARDLPARQQTLRSAIDWSYSLLGEGERKLFAALSVFAGGCTVEAAEAANDAQGEPSSGAPWATLDGIASLLAKSLLQQVGDDASHFVMLETIREYAQERLDESGNAEQTRRRYADFYRSLAEQARAALSGPDQAVWARQLEAEHDNLRAILRWAQTEGRADVALGLSGCLWPFWRIHGHLNEGLRWLNEALAIDAQVPIPVRAEGLNGASVLANEVGDYERARVHAEEMLALCRSTENTEGMTLALSNLGVTAECVGDLQLAERYHNEALALNRERGISWDVAVDLHNLGGVALGKGNVEQAKKLLDESLVMLREIGDVGPMAASLTILGDVARLQANPEQAATYYRESLLLQRDAGNSFGIAENFEGLGQVAGTRHQPERFARLAGAAEALRHGIANPRPPGRGGDYEPQLAQSRGELHEADWNRAWQEGHAMSLQRAISYALEETPSDAQL